VDPTDCSTGPLKWAVMIHGPRGPDSFVSQRIKATVRQVVSAAGHQTLDAFLELAVLGGVDERVDAAVGEHQYHAKVVEPAVPGEKMFTN